MRAEEKSKKDDCCNCQMKKKTKTAKVLFSLFAAFALLCCVFYLADFKEIKQRLLHSDPLLLFLSLLSYSMTYIARARRFAAAGAKASTWTLLCLVSVHGALNRIMPLKTGELSYPLLARRVGAAAFGQGVVQLLLLRLLDLVTVVLLFLLALTISFLLGFEGMGKNSNAFTLISILACGLCILALWKLEHVLSYMVLFARSFLTLLKKTYKTPMGTKFQNILEKADHTIHATMQMSPFQKIRLGFWSVICWASYFLLFHLILSALALEISFLDTVLGSSAAIIGSTIPISGLGTFGALEGGWTAGFIALGLDTSTAASTAIVMSSLTLIFAAFLGCIGWLCLMRRIPR